MIQEEFRRVADGLRWTLHPQLRAVTDPARQEIESVIVSGKTKKTLDMVSFLCGPLILNAIFMLVRHFQVTIHEGNYEALVKEIAEITDQEVEGAIPPELQARRAHLDLRFRLALVALAIARRPRAADLPPPLATLLETCHCVAPLGHGGHRESHWGARVAI